MRSLVILPLIALTFVAAPAGSQPVPAVPVTAAPPERPKEPAKQIDRDIREFVDALKHPDNIAASSLVDGARVGYYGANEWFKYPRNGIEVESVKVDKIEGDDAWATVSYRLTPAVIFQPQGKALPLPPPIPNAAPGELQQETVRVRRSVRRVWFETERWRVVVGEVGESPSFLHFSAQVMKQGPDSLTLIRRNEAMRRLKSLNLAARCFALDWDDRCAFDTANAADALAPYLHDDDAFTVPGTTDTFRFNGRLTATRVGHVMDSAHTVFFYDGQDEKLNYRYNNRALVGFVDGHVEIIDAEKAKTLVWQP